MKSEFEYEPDKIPVIDVHAHVFPRKIPCGVCSAYSEDLLRMTCQKCEEGSNQNQVY